MFWVVCAQVQRLKAGATILPLFLELRQKMLKAQRLVRDYLLIKQARLLLLSKKWDYVRSRTM
jgi:hypothetical protein